MEGRHREKIFFDLKGLIANGGIFVKMGSYYYPFGLTMSGISSKALSFGEPKNKEKTFQGQRFDDELGLNWIQFKWRNHDPQIGRFIEIDPLSEKYVYNSTYAFSENKVTSNIELEGLEAAMLILPKDLTNQQVNDVFKGYEQSITRGAIAVAIVATVVAAIVVPGFAAAVSPILAAEVFGFPSPTRPTSMASTVFAETKAVVSLETRANEIHSALKPATQSRTTTAVASATTAEGNQVTLVASSEPTLRPVQQAALKPGEIAVKGAGHAEATIINHATANGMTVGQIAASRPICVGCAGAISGAGAAAASPLKKIVAGVGAAAQ